MTEPESHQFPKDQLLTDGFVHVDNQPSLDVKLKPQGEENWGECKYIPLRIDQAIRRG